MPINNKNVDSAEKAIMEGVKVQPFISEASVKIRRDSLKSGEGTYSPLRIDIKYGVAFELSLFHYFRNQNTLYILTLVFLR